MLNIQNKIAYFINFKKRIYSYTHYTHRAYFYIYNKTTLLITILAKNIARKFLIKREYKKEKYEMKGENKTTIKTKITE